MSDAMLSRRHALGLLAAGATPVALFTGTPKPALATTLDVSENAELLAAYARFKQASTDKAAAEEALIWIADEWRHLWPLAPEELLGGANADHGGGQWGETAERDILGNFLERDTSTLTKRLDARQRTNTPSTCFSVMTPEDAAETLAVWRKHVPKGRTATALEKSCAHHEKTISLYERKLFLAREYQAETERVRDAAGVKQAKERLRVASAAVAKAREEISMVPAVTLQGLAIKAEAVQATGLFSIMHKGVIAELSRFAQAVKDVASAGESI